MAPIDPDLVPNEAARRKLIVRRYATHRSLSRVVAGARNLGKVLAAMGRLEEACSARSAPPRWGDERTPKRATYRGWIS